MGERKEIRMDLGDGNKIIVSKKNGWEGEVCIEYMKVGKSMSVYIEKGRVKKVYYKVKDISRG